MTPATLEGMAFRLSKSGDTIGLLGLLDAWQAEDEPTVAARFLHAQTLIDLCMIDKATTILAGLSAIPEVRSRAWTMTGRAYLARGWHRQAREVLLKALDDALEPRIIETLIEKTEQPPASMDPGFNCLEQAEWHLVRGDQGRARRALADHLGAVPEDARAMLLQRVIEGTPVFEGSLREWVLSYPTTMEPEQDAGEDMAEEADPTELVEEADPTEVPEDADPTETVEQSIPTSGFLSLSDMLPGSPEPGGFNDEGAPTELIDGPRDDEDDWDDDATVPYQYENTESSDASRPPATSEPTDPSNPNEGGFPSLFRGAQRAFRGLLGHESEKTTMGRSEEERTVTHHETESMVADQEPSITGDANTDILRVVPRRPMSKAAGQLHVNPPEPPDPGFSLDEFRREMGAHDTLPDPSSDFEDVGDEDDDIVVMRTRDFTDSHMSLLPDPAEDTMSHPDASRFLSEEARALADRDFIAHAKTPKPAERSVGEPTEEKPMRPGLPAEAPYAQQDELAWSSKAGCLAIMVALGLCIVVLTIAMAARIIF